MMSRREESMPVLGGWLVSTWVASLSEVLEQTTGERPHVERLHNADVASAPGGLLWWSQWFSIAEGPAVWIGAAEDDCLDLMRRTSSQWGRGKDALEELGEVLAAAFSGLGKALSRRGPGDIACGAAQHVFSVPENLPAIAVDVIFAESRPLRFFWMMDPEFLGLLQEAIGRPDVARESEAPRDNAAPTSETLALLLDLELPVSVSFGRVQIPFQDVLKLSTGSIIELNRSVDDPVDIIVNEQVIASGEVVVVNGSYGVRVKHIASRTERLRSADSVLLARGFEVNPWDEGAAV